MRTELRVAALIGCAALVAGLAWGEEGKPVTGVRPWKVSLSLGADYTDNRDDAPDALAEDTFDFRVKPRFDLFVNPSRTLFDMFYAPSWRYRTEPSASQNEDEFWHEAGLALEHEFSPVTAAFLRHRLDYTDDPALDNNGDVVREDMSYFLNRTEAGVMQDLTQTWSFDLTGRYRDKSYDKTEVANNNDETRADGEGKLMKHLTPTLNVYGLGRYSDYGYESSTGLDRDFASMLLALGCEKDVNPLLKTGLALGWQGQEYDDDTISDDGVPYVMAWARCLAVPQTRINGEVSHGLRDSDVYPFASQEYTEVRLGCEYDLTPDVMVGLTGMYRLSDYDGYASAATPDSAFEVGNRSGNEDRFAADLTLGYAFAPMARVSLIQSYEERSSDVANDFTKNTTKLIFTREF